MLVCFKISILGVDLKHIYMGLCIQILSTVLATALCTEISCRLMNTRKRLIHRVQLLMLYVLTFTAALIVRWIMNETSAYPESQPALDIVCAMHVYTCLLSPFHFLPMLQLKNCSFYSSYSHYRFCWLLFMVPCFCVYFCFVFMMSPCFLGFMQNSLQPELNQRGISFASPR